MDKSNSKEFVEKKALFEIEKAIVELKHEYNLAELKLQRENSHADHLEKMGEIRLKNANIQRSYEERERINREDFERKRMRFGEKNGQST